ncbi:FAD-dependent oxidoreductase [Sphingomonas glacialis]|nr:GMC family oxidoreductase [Sphingomonas glacialis]
MTDLPDTPAIAGSVCVVGAGPVGIALALRLAELGRDVVLLEAGGTTHDASKQDAYRGTVTDPALHYPLDEYRERRLGGTSTIWGGRCMPLDPIDFAPRDWIPDSGWPIGPDALAAYYPDANRLCEAGAFAYTLDAAFPDVRKPMIAGFAGQHFTSDTLERFSCPTDFGKRYRDRLAQSPRIRVLLGAAVTHIALNADGTAVTGLSVRTDAGATVPIVAQAYVLATGGLETARLLLASRDVQPSGIGNAHDVVGRYYMCHLAGTIGAFHATGAVWHGYDMAADGSYCRRRLALTAETQTAQRIGNFVARLHHPRIADPAHGASVLSALYLGRMLVPAHYRKRLADEGAGGIATTARHAWNIARDPLAVAGFAKQMLVDRRLAERKFPSVVVAPKNNVYSLDFHAEQEPQPDSRVTLGEDRDAFGMPRLTVDWRYTRGDVTTVQTALALLSDDLARSGCGRFDFDPDMVETEMTRYGAYGGHHIGTARMGDDPRRSVVDKDCRVHGIANLHLAGAAVFPTSSQANPTLTAVALALRLADRLQVGAA